MAEPADSNPTETSPPPVVHPPVGNPYLAGALAWLIRGLGHIYVKRLRRGLGFLALVVAAIAIGCALQGNLAHPVPNQPISLLATLGTIGMGVPYFVLRFALGYTGSVIVQLYKDFAHKEVSRLGFLRGFT